MSKKKTPHRHAERFDFDLPRNLAVLVCERVSRGAAVQHVFRDADGDWQFLCEGDHASENQADAPLLACLEEVVARDPTLNELAELGLNYSASRPAPGAGWTLHDEHEDFIREAVGEHGWAVQLVPADDSAEEPAFAYTAGLWTTFQHAEVIVFGLPLEDMYALLESCGERIKQSGRPLPVDETMADLVDGRAVKLRSVRERTSYEEHVGYALWLHDGAEFPLLQLLWSDVDGKFPDDESASPDVRAAQPLLP